MPMPDDQAKCLNSETLNRHLAMGFPTGFVIRGAEELLDSLALVRPPTVQESIALPLKQHLLLVTLDGGEGSRGKESK